MPVFRSACSVLSFVACALAVLSAGARADELLVMPYSCRVVGGQPVLTPSEDQGHAVIGRREQREFRACSPVNPDFCHRWTVHRFDLDCGGKRVPWIEVAAAAGDRQDGRAFVADGRLELEMPARWSLPAHSPCARERDVEEDRFGALARFCSERSARARRLTVAMPAGFAPLLGIDGIFVTDPAGRGAVADAAPQGLGAGSEPRDLEPRNKAPRAEAPSPPPEPVKKKAAPSPLPDSGRSKETEVAAAKATPAPAPKQEPEPSAPAASETPAPKLAPVMPTIINSELVSAPPSAKKPEPDPVDTSSDLAARTDSQVAGSSATAPDHPSVSNIEVSALPDSHPGWRLDANVTTVSVAGLALLLLLSLVIVRRRQAPLLARDISAVSFGSGADRPAAGALVPFENAATDVGAPLPPAGPPVPIGDAMPRTREEALTILGMGIAPDVNETAIKKIIDGLRLSWHPDHARDPEDRKLRELRLKQINAAWDIIAARRAS